MYNLTTKKMKVDNILHNSPARQIIELKGKNQKITKGVNYLDLTGGVEVGDQVLVNTTAVELDLGTGGYHFVTCNLDKPEINVKSNNYGHIMKMRYTPFQIKTLSVEEEKHPAHQKIQEFSDLAGQMVVILPLHSLLAPLAIVFKKMFPDKKLVYIMTEGGSLALKFSNLVLELTNKGYIDQTITVGHAFGGDIEAINIYTGLAAAQEVAKADLIVTGMGPGIAGTGTRLGFSGVENSFISYAVNNLRGRSLIVPRISFAEKRERHFILSHHTITLLEELIKNRVEVVLPEEIEVIKRIKNTNIENKHDIFYYKYNGIEHILEDNNYDFYSMGRHLKDDKLFFITGGLPVLRYRELIKE